MTASKSISSCAMAPPMGGSMPNAPSIMPAKLKTMPPTALWSAILSHPSADVHQLVDLSERTFEDHGIGSFGGDVAFVAKRDADGCGLHSGSIVDAITDENGFSKLRFCANHLDFFFGTLRGIGGIYSDFFSQGANFRFAVAGNENDFRHLMARQKVRNEDAAVRAGRILEPK